MSLSCASKLAGPARFSAMSAMLHCVMWAGGVSPEYLYSARCARFVRFAVHALRTPFTGHLCCWELTGGVLRCLRTHCKSTCYMIGAAVAHPMALIPKSQIAPSVLRK